MNLNQFQQQAFQHFQGGEYKEAATWYDRARQSNPNLTSNYWYLGLALLLAGEEAEGQAVWFSVLAEANVEESDRHLAELVDILTAEGARCLHQGQLQPAEIIYRQLVEVDGDNAEFFYYLGNAIAFQGREDEAIATWRRAVELKPDFLAVYQSLASLFYRLKEFNKAIPYYLKIIEIKPDCYESYYNLGLCFCQVNKLAEGINCFRVCLQIQPDYSPAWGDLGISLLKVGNLEEAIASWQKTVSLVGIARTTLGFEDGEIYWRLKEALMEKGDVKGAIAVHQKYLETFPELAAESALNFGRALAEDIAETLPKIPHQNPATIPAPDGGYQSSLDWAFVNGLDTKNYLDIYPPNTLKLRPPRTADGTPHFSFRFGNKINLAGTFVVTIPNGRYWLDERQITSAVIASDNKILGDISPQFPVFSPGHPENDPTNNRIFTLNKLPPFQEIKGTVIVLSGILNDSYFHWLFDILPRLELLRRGGIDFKKADKFLVHNSQAFQRETLEKLGIPKEKILEGDRHRHIRATNLVVPSFPGSIAWMPKWACNFLRREFLPAEVNEKIEKLYISRKDASYRRLINEEEIVNLLEKNGFQSVALEGMSVSKQAGLLANAKVVVSPHGGGLSNLVFCNKGTKVIEIFSPEYVYHCYWLVSNILGLEYYYVLGEMPEGFYWHQLLNPNPRLEDIFVNPQKLLDVLKFARVVSKKGPVREGPKGP